MTIQQILSKWKQRLGRVEPGLRDAQNGCFGHFELLERRCMLASDLLNLGVVYHERDLGSDISGDTFEVTFAGGAAGTQLTRLIVNSDHEQLGFGSADIIFDTETGGRGADHAFAFTVRELVTHNPLATLTSQVTDGGSALIVDLERFQAGDRLIMEIDVDEVEFINSQRSDPEHMHLGIDPVTSGIEFQGVRLSAEFTAPGHFQSGGMSMFWNAYDPELLASGLDLPSDNYESARDRTAGAFIRVAQQQRPSELSGQVWMDSNFDQQFDAADRVLAGVQVELWKKESGVYRATGLVQSTDAAGQYRFTDMEPGAYEVRERQPQGLISSAAFAGELDGVTVGVVQGPDVISEILVSGGGQYITGLDFAEAATATIEGTVFTVLVGQEIPTADVQLQLDCGDPADNRTTITDQGGRYRFDGILPGTCSVEEFTPLGLFDGHEVVGTIDGETVGESDGLDTIEGIQLPSGARAVNYDFYEQAPASISGLVFQDDETVIVESQEQIAGVPAPDGELTADDRRLHGIQISLTNLETRDVQSTTTNERGEFSFGGLQPGVYELQESHPQGFQDGVDRAGTAGGAVVEAEDRITNIELSSGAAAVDYYFSEYRVKVVVPVEPEVPVVSEPPLQAEPLPVNIIESHGVEIVLPPATRGQVTPEVTAIPVYAAGNTVESGLNTWHLSVVDGGMPRGAILNIAPVQPVSFTHFARWDQTLSNSGVWLAKSLSGAEIPMQHVMLGFTGSRALAADFNGDGIAEVALYSDGYWFIDINGNGRWDEEDLWAQMGAADDLPVAGDWDGDGKDDIGVYGLSWPGDDAVLAADPGLPDLENRETTLPKNVPPPESLAASRRRLLQATAQGDVRADVIDHVFQYGQKAEVAVTGDWNGDGVVNLGTYRDGQWKLDSNGDGRISDGERVITFGRPGDIPVVGDFNGDGIDQIGVYRAGQWLLDSNDNQELDSVDQVFEMGSDLDQPVVADFDGDGVDDVAVYRVKKAG
ncbi:MAG: SdrD B-like domain-containing protein [Planctomycetota bacterium]|nr:SdrD B-like domain-containing protein [Planctomycetota bacterium]